jgi:hypothetical protein
VGSVLKRRCSQKILLLNFFTAQEVVWRILCGVCDCGENRAVVYHLLLCKISSFSKQSTKSDHTIF